VNSSKLKVFFSVEFLNGRSIFFKERPIYLSLQNSIPIKVGKEGAFGNLFDPKAFTLFLLQKPLNQVPELVREYFRFFNFLFANQVWKLFCALLRKNLKGRNARNHFVEQNAKLPPVNGLVVAELLVYLSLLRSLVLHVSNETFGLFFCNDHPLWKRKVNESAVPIFVNQNILWLQISIGDST